MNKLDKIQSVDKTNISFLLKFDSRFFTIDHKIRKKQELTSYIFLYKKT